MNRVVTDFLTPKTTLLTGMGTILNLVGSYYQYSISPTPEEADRRAIASDWRMVGQDIKDAILHEKAEILASDPQLSLAL
jgi:hypothetical protein